MSGQAPSGQEKSHEATPRKLEQARRKGELPRSTDAQTAAAYLGLTAAVLLLGGWTATRLGETLMAYLARPAEMAALHLAPGGDGFALTGLSVLAAVAPVLALPAALILALLLAQRAIVAAPGKLKPKLSRLSPIANAKQKFGPHGLMEFAKSAVKLTAVGTVLVLVLLDLAPDLPGLARTAPRALGHVLEDQFRAVATGVVILALALAAIDLVWQRHRHRRSQRMTHQELKDETRTTEGDPQIRASRRDRARQIASNRMLNDVPGASVVVTNPEHYAIALTWDRAGGGVPVCVAKGVDEIARQIRLRAQQAGVPVREDPPTARSLHALVEIGQPIRPEHYKAVAAAIIFADRLRATRRERTG